MKNAIEENIKWISDGNTGCLFAQAFSKNPEKIGWKFTDIHDLSTPTIPKNAYIVSMVFDGWNKESVKAWALKNTFYLEDTDEKYEGLRIKINDKVSWVQYFGPDSHVPTRRTPHAMLTFTIKLPKQFFHVVGFNGILHLAHASILGIAPKAAQRMWDRSFIKTKERLGFKPTVAQAAKTTFIK